MTNVYQLSGGMTAFLADSIARAPGIQLTSLRHEQAAGFAAEGFARVTGLPAVAMGTSGPGATNLVTAIASAYFDSVPVVFITGQVHQNEIKKNQLQRQNGFQELDIVSLTSGITKFSRRVESASEIQAIFQNALHISTAGRPGPTLIDLPINIQQHDVSFVNPIIDRVENQTLGDFADVATFISESQKPLILAGGGIRISKVTNEFSNFVEKFQIPVVTSLMGIDAISSDSRFKVGMIGSYGNRWANRALMQSDLLLVLGSRLDIRQTGSDLTQFSKNRKIIRVDIDETEITGRVTSDVSYTSPLSDFFSFFENFQYESNPKHQEILIEAKRHSSQRSQEMEQVDLIGINPSELMRVISDEFTEAEGYVVDVGQHQMWAAQSLKLQASQRFLTSGGMGAMGFSIPASIGAWHANRGKWVVILGDGCAQLSLTEFQSLKDIQPDLVVIIINNHQQGMVAQFQEEYLDSRYVGTRNGYSVPNFARVADAFGIKSFQINTIEQGRSTFKSVQPLQEPVIIEVDISNAAKALPKNAFGIE